MAFHKSVFKSTAAALLLIGFVLLCLVWRDPINRLEFDLLFPANLSGFAALVRLPESSSAEDVIQASSQFHHFRILETRRIQALTGTAVWIDSDRGEKLVLIRYDPTGWFVQVREP